MIPLDRIDTEFLAGVDTVDYSELPPVKICPHILDYVTRDIIYHLVSNRPRNYIRERINKHILWDLSNKRLHGDRVITVKFWGQPIWTEGAILKWQENRNHPNRSNSKGLQLEHNNERIWYTDQLQALDIKQENLYSKVKSLLSTSTFTVVTPEFHSQLENGITDPGDPWKRYRPLAPKLYWIDWVKQGRWSIERIRKINIDR